MPNTNDIAWFKQEFGAKIAQAVVGTPLTLDMLAALACQETGYIWQRLRKRSGLSLADVLALCVGDSLDRARTFPTNKGQLVAWPRGKEMFDLARAKLVEIARYFPEYKRAARDPSKFCHGFGIFQYDIQFFKKEPNYFLGRDWEQFEPCLDKALAELRRGLAKFGWQDRTSLTDYEFACVAIVYNTGGFNPRKGLKQGHQSDGRFYGENIFEFVRLARAVPWPGGHELVEAGFAGGGEAQLPPVRPLGGGDRRETVDIGDLIALQPAPGSGSATIAMLPAGHAVAVVGRAAKGVVRVETVLGGNLFEGYVETNLLRGPRGGANETAPLLGAITAAVPEAHLPRVSGSVTKRSQIANAYSLNEQGMPRRTGSTVSELTASLAEIIEWLDTEKTAHKRYRPRSGLTFCNIYAHDYCGLAGAYLPRVWWTGPALMKIANGQQVEPQYDKTVDEVRANDLFRWLRDFGPGFGWRRATSLMELQNEVNGGAVGLVVARRKVEGRSGHIVVVVPETGKHSAVRNAKGAVTKPLQSQAGSVNFKYGTGKLNWWLGDQFAESAFWLHA